jgi:hypothetical protein
MGSFSKFDSAWTQKDPENSVILSDFIIFVRFNILLMY